MSGCLMVCGTTSDAGKSFLVAGLCRLLARQGVRVAPFKAQNMANNASVTADGAEIGHAQWLQAVAAGVDPVSAMNPILLKPTSERTSQVVVRGRPLGEMSADAYHRLKPDLRPRVLEALEELRAGFDVVICEGAGSPAEINLLERDIVNLSLAEEADMPAIVVGDIDRGGVFAALYGTVALLPETLRSRVKGFVVNKLRGDPELLGSACTDLEERCGVPTLGVIPYVPGPDLDGEDSLTLDNQTHPGDPPVPEPERHRLARPGTAHSSRDSDLRDVIDVVAIRWPLIANAGDLDPLRVEPHVRVRWVRSPAELGRPDLVVLPGSKATRSDLEWFRATGLAGAVQATEAPVVGICAGLQMCGTSIEDPDGVEGPPGTATGLSWLMVTTTFQGDKVLDRPTGKAVDGPGRGEHVSGYRIHHGRVHPAPPNEPAPEDAQMWESTRARTTQPLLDAELATWLVADDGTPLGWCSAPPVSSLPTEPGQPDTFVRDGTPGEPGNPTAKYVFGTTLHAVFEGDGFRAAFLTWIAQRAGKTRAPSGVSFEALRQDRLDRIADTLETHLDMDRVAGIITEHRTGTESSAGADHTEGIAT